MHGKPQIFGNCVHLVMHRFSSVCASSHGEEFLQNIGGELKALPPPALVLLIGQRVHPGLFERRRRSGSRVISGYHNPETSYKSHLVIIYLCCIVDGSENGGTRRCFPPEGQELRHESAADDPHLRQ